MDVERELALAIVRYAWLPEIHDAALGALYVMRRRRWEEDYRRWSHPKGPNHVR